MIKYTGAGYYKYTEDDEVFKSGIKFYGFHDKIYEEKIDEY